MTGLLLTSPGRSIDPTVVATLIAELSQRYIIRGLAYDRWRMDDLLREFDRVGLQAYKDGDKGDGLRLVPWGQGFKDMGPAIDALELAIVERKLVHPSNPVLNWNMANAVATMDPAGNRKLDKDKARFQDRRRGCAGHGDGAALARSQRAGHRRGLNDWLTRKAPPVEGPTAPGAGPGNLLRRIQRASATKFNS